MCRGLTLIRPIFVSLNISISQAIKGKHRRSSHRRRETHTTRLCFDVSRKQKPAKLSMNLHIRDTWILASTKLCLLLRTTDTSLRETYQISHCYAFGEEPSLDIWSRTSRSNQREPLIRLLRLLTTSFLLTSTVRLRPRAVSRFYS